MFAFVGFIQNLQDLTSVIRRNQNLKDLTRLLARRLRRARRRSPLCSRCEWRPSPISPRDPPARVPVEPFGTGKTWEMITPRDLLTGGIVLRRAIGIVPL